MEEKAGEWEEGGEGRGKEKGRGRGKGKGGESVPLALILQFDHWITKSRGMSVLGGILLAGHCRRRSINMSSFPVVRLSYLDHERCAGYGIGSSSAQSDNMRVGHSSGYSFSTVSCFKNFCVSLNSINNKGLRSIAQSLTVGG